MSETQRIQTKWAALQEGIPGRLDRINTLLADGDIQGAAAVGAWFSHYRDMLDLYFWLDDAETAKAAHFAYAVDTHHACANYAPELIEAALRYGYHNWAYQMRDYVRGADILDVGCGNGLYGTAFLMMGARSYIGVDPSIALDANRIKDKRKRRMVEIPMTLREMTGRNPAVSLVPSGYEDFAATQKFDLISLHNVTEHLHDIDTILPDLRRHLRDDGRLIYMHHNFYCWNGHHGLPRTVDQIDPDNRDQQDLIDWKHILNAEKFPPNHFVHRKLNRIRFDELKRLTGINFDIEKWTEIPSPPETLDRLTPGIWDRLQAFDSSLTRTDLEINLSVCVAKPKAQPS